MCLVPLGAIVGGVLYFVNRKKKTQAPALVNQATPYQPYQPAPAPVAPVAQPVQQPFVQPPAQPQPVAQPVTRAEPVAAPGSLSVSPSELVVLRADAFSPTGGKFNYYTLLGTDQKVDLSVLARAMLAAAFLALREAGDVRLEPGKRKATLGLREVDALYVVPTGKVTAWPKDCYEARLLAMANDMAAKQNNHVNRLVYQALGQDSANPESMAVNLCLFALQQRGLLGIEEKKGFLGVKTSNFVMPAETQAALAQTQAGVESVQGLLGRFQQSEPASWNLLENELKGALKDRIKTESSNDF